MVSVSSMQSLIGQLLGLSNVVMQIDVTKKEREDEDNCDENW